MKNVIALLAGLSLLNGCAHTRVAAFDKQDAKVTVCGNRYATDEKLEIAAQNACHSDRVSLVSGFENRELAGMSRGLNGFTGPTVQMDYKKEQCNVYSCN